MRVWAFVMRKFLRVAQRVFQPVGKVHLPCKLRGARAVGMSALEPPDRGHPQKRVAKESRGKNPVVQRCGRRQPDLVRGKCPAARVAADDPVKLDPVDGEIGKRAVETQMPLAKLRVSASSKLVPEFL
ncbi:MAG: hypothetical protein M9957_00630 [Rhodobacteraceae bacterium]|nr:hypothetical protein [Paracoccaceae bacterium]